MTQHPAVKNGARQVNVAPASEAMVAPKKKRKMPIAVIPVCDFFSTNISNRRREKPRAR